MTGVGLLPKKQRGFPVRCDHINVYDAHMHVNVGACTPLKTKEGEILNTDLIKRFPGWVLDMTQHPNDYMAVMSNDYDSFLSCRYLRYVLGVPIGGYYDFSSGVYLTEDAMKDNRTPVFMDVSLIKNGICAFDNHYLYSNNCMIANPNGLLTYADRCTYNRKFPGSTFLFMYALFNDREINQFEKMALMAIDGFFSGFFNENGAFRYINEAWLDRLGLRSVLIETIDTHTRKDYELFLAKYGYENKFLRSADDGCLYEYSDSCSALSALLLDDKKLCFPHHVLSVKQSYCGYSDMTQGYLRGEKTQPEKGLFSIARTSKNRFAYSAITDDTHWRYSDEQKRDSAA